MAKLGEGRTSAQTFDGSAIVMVNAGEVTLNTATATPQSVGKTMVPWSCTIVKAWYSVRTTTTVTTNTLNLGTMADTDAFIDALIMATGTAGVFEIPLNTTQTSTFVSAAVSAGDVVAWTFDANLTSAAGVLSALAILSPNA